MRTFLLLCVLALLPLAGRAEEERRVKLSRLLEPATRVAALEEFFRQDADAAAGDHAWAADHGDVRVTPLHESGGNPLWLVTWRGELPLFSWYGQDNAEVPAEPAASILLPAEQISALLLDLDGKVIARPESEELCGVIADLRGEGRPEIIEDSLNVYANKTLTVLQAGYHLPAQAFGCEYLTVHGLRETAPMSVIVFNAHSLQSSAEIWSWECTAAGPAGPGTITLGPPKQRDGVEPRVVFHWNAAEGLWEGPPAGPGAHFRVLSPEGFQEELTTLVEAGGLGYAAPELPQAAAEKEAAPESSLAALKDGALLARMQPILSPRFAPGQCMRVPAFSAPLPGPAVSSFRTRPEEAALALWRAGRKPVRHRVEQPTFVSSAGVQPPTSGDVVLRLAPHFTSWADLVQAWQIHCAAEGSFLAYSAAGPALPAGGRAWGLQKSFDLRLLPLAEADARHLLQTVWWLSRLRVRVLNPLLDGPSEETQEFEGLLQVRTPGQALEFDQPVWDTPEASSQYYAPGNFVSLVLRLLEREVPAHLGQAWLAGRSPGAAGQGLTPEALPTETRAALHRAALDQLQLGLRGYLAPDLLLPTVMAAARVGWEDAVPALEALAPALPPLSEKGEEVLALWREVRQWRRELGPQAVSFGRFQERESERDGGKAQGALPADRFKAGRLDAADGALGRMSRVSSEVPEFEWPNMALQAGMDQTLEQIRCRNDVPGLLHMEVTDPDDLAFVVTRLGELDPGLALWYLRTQIKDPDLADRTVWLEDEKLRLSLHPTFTPQPGPLQEGWREEALETLRNSGAPAAARRRALDLLVPPDAPRRYEDAALDQLLLDLLARPMEEEEIPLPGLFLAAAARLGERAWDPLEKRSQRVDGPSWTGEVLSALTLLAREKPELYRARLRQRLAQELPRPAADYLALLRAAWVLDLRGPQESILPAPAEPGDPTEAQSPPAHNLARLRALWEERDRVACARALAAFTVQDEALYEEPRGGGAGLIRARLAEACAGLSSPERAQVQATLRALEARTSREDVARSALVQELLDVAGRP